jgi:glycosyltransferase involved in cell wall biosynthesis
LTIRKKHGIGEEDFLIVAGGKIDSKKNIHLLMQAVSELNIDNVKLLVFGDPSDDIKEQFSAFSTQKNIYCIGWIESDATYDYFLAADLVFFPGQHSVMWEQAVACGTPCVFKHYHAMHHCDIGGNCRFLREDSVEAIKSLLIEIIQSEVYEKMLCVALSDNRKRFLYSELAKKSIDI